MSAYQVHPDTIDLIISAARSYNTGFRPRQHTTPPYSAGFWNARTDAQAMADCLWAANAASVAYRYRETAEVLPYTFRPVSLEHVALGDNPHALVLAAIRCLRYQSCEVPDYDETDAARLLDAIEREAVGKLAAVVYAPWGWTREQAATRDREMRAKVAATMYPAQSEARH